MSETDSDKRSSLLRYGIDWKALDIVIIIIEYFKNVIIVFFSKATNEEIKKGELGNKIK